MRTTWPLRMVVGSLFVATLIATVVGLGHGPASATRLIYVAVAGIWLAVSQTIIERLPGHPIGRVMLGFGGLMAFYIFWDVIIAMTFGDPSVAVVAWVISLLDGPLFLLSPFTREQTIAVAASTLAVFALFQPLRRRVQAAVDRRFDRARYDADQTVRSFATRQRGDLDMGTVRSEIIGTATSAVRPTKAAVWLRGTER
jgi:lipid-A-disaccharide synthase-like uncharacterized protein